MLIERPVREFIPSLRECIVARDHCWFSSTDYDSGELVTHSQSCIWTVDRSELAVALNAGRKVHNALGARMIGMTYDEFQARVKEAMCKNARQAAKPGNFGFPGGMGAPKMVLTQRRQGPDTQCDNGPHMIEVEGMKELVPGYKGLRFCILMNGARSCGMTSPKRREWRGRPIKPMCAECIECAVRLKATWLEQWPENKPYFDFVSACVERGMVIQPESLERWPWLQEVFTPYQRLAPGEIMQHVSGRIRNVATSTTESPFCSAANGFFQGLLAEISKAAACRVSRECYDRTVIVPDLAHENSRRSRFTGGPSPLFGSRMIGFFHDELLCEHPDSIAPEAAERVSEIMVEEEMNYCPDLVKACKAPAALMTKWIKQAEPWYERGGSKPADPYDRLMPWDLRQAA